MRFDRNRFWSEYRDRFGSVKQEQIAPLENLLTLFSRYYGWWDDMRQIANALAQIKLETNSSYLPVVEAYYLGDENKPNYYQGNTATVKKVQERFKYYPYFGRGHIQTTHLKNYQKANGWIKKWFPEIAAKHGNFDLTKQVELALDFEVSFAIMTVGMITGGFTGKALDDYIVGDRADYYNARSVVNGDKHYKDHDNSEITIGDRIARDSKRFFSCLIYALISDGTNTPQIEDKKQIDLVTTQKQGDNTSTVSPKIDMDLSPDSTKTEVEVKDGNISVSTSTTDTPPEPDNRAIVKPPPKDFIETVKGEVSAVTGGNLGVSAIAEVSEKFNFLGLSANFWSKIVIFVAVASVIYLLFRFYKHRSDTKRDLEITNELLKANSTPENKVMLIDADKVDEYKQKGYKIIER